MNQIKFKEIAPATVAGAYRIRLEFTQDMLGTKPCTDVATKYLQSRMTKANRAARDLTDEDRIAKMNEKKDAAESGTNIFYRDEAGNPLLQGYMILGFLKEAAATQMNDRTKLASKFYSASLKTKIEQMFSVREEWIRIETPEGWEPKETVELRTGVGDETKTVERYKLVERTLRAEVRGVVMTSVAKSEVVPAGSAIEFTIELRSESVKTGSGKDSPTVKSYDMLVELLGEGCRRGIGQWRNSGAGRFKAFIGEED